MSIYFKNLNYAPFLSFSHCFNGKNSLLHKHFFKSTSVTPIFFLNTFALNTHSCITVKIFRFLVELLDICHWGCEVTSSPEIPEFS
jgi:hypothetical protein